MKNKLNNQTRSGFINSSFSVLDALFAPAVILISTPVFINKLGIEGYGVWVLINSISFLMSFVNIGGVDTLLRHIPLNRNNGKEYANELFISLTIAQIILLLGGCILGWIIVENIPVDKLFKMAGSNLNSHTAGIVLGLGIFSLKIIEQMVLGYYKAYERYDISTFYSFVSKLAVLSVQIITVQYSNEVQSLLINTFLALFAIVNLDFYCLKKDEGVSLSKNFNIMKLSNVSNHIRWSWLNSVSGPIAGQVDKWIVALVANVASLSAYHIAISVFEMIISILSAAINWLYPKSASHGNAIDNAAYIYYMRIGAILMFAGFAISFLLINLDFLFILWLGAGAYKQVSHFMDNVLLFVPLYCVGMVPYFIIKGYGLIKYIFYAEILNSVVKYASVYMLYNIYYVDALIVAYGICGLFLAWYYVKIINVKVLASKRLNIYLVLAMPVLYVILMKN